MIDLLYLAKGRPEFTQASADALVANTNWDLVNSLHVYFDGQRNSSAAKFVLNAPGDVHFYPQEIGGPVAIMNNYLAQAGSPIFAKIDNDVIVPPGWLDHALAVMNQQPELDLLGIEPPASRTAAPWSTEPVRHPESAVPWAPGKSGYAPCDSIGGIGLMRRSAFAGRPAMRPHAENGVGGFTDWQLSNPAAQKGWLVPPLRLFLLDRLPFEPWASLSKRYIAEGIQRPWTNYDPEDKRDLWGWWA